MYLGDRSNKVKVKVKRRMGSNLYAFIFKGVELTYILILRMAVNFQSTHDLWGELIKDPLTLSYPGERSLPFL